MGWKVRASRGYFWGSTKSLTVSNFQGDAITYHASSGIEEGEKAQSPVSILRDKGVYLCRRGPSDEPFRGEGILCGSMPTSSQTLRHGASCGGHEFLHLRFPKTSSSVPSTFMRVTVSCLHRVLRNYGVTGAVRFPIFDPVKSYGDILSGLVP